MARAVMHINRGDVDQNYFESIDVPDDATVEQTAVLALEHLAQTLTPESKHERGFQVGHRVVRAWGSAALVNDVGIVQGFGSRPGIHGTVARCYVRWSAANSARWVDEDALALASRTGQVA